jgi:beta-phosphoglucomutase-like phosphatase (HAD superfamily)
MNDSASNAAMNEPLPKYCDNETAARIMAGLGEEFAVVENPAYVFPRFELYPLPAKRYTLARGLAGAVMDMDGTTTTTEPLCIHSLDTMVRRITGNADNPNWPGLDHDRDYPHIIGNSTTKHVEYLVETYAGGIVPSALHRWYIYAAAWTLGKAADAGRRREVAATLAAVGLRALLEDPRFQALQAADNLEAPDARAAIGQIALECGEALDAGETALAVRLAIDIYYQRYHEILAAIARGEGDSIARDVLGDAGAHLIEPMPGIGLFLAMLKGLLGEELASCREQLAGHLTGDLASTGVLAALGRHFEQHPARVAIVTSSIAYEAEIVLGEVFRLLAERSAQWPISEGRRRRIAAVFAEPRAYYDGIVTASDSSEIRLKPHRDLYCLALHRLGLHPGDFDRVAGFEDSESGAIAIRAAGIPLCCALPFTMTQGHAFHAASHVCTGGIPEVLLRHTAFLPPALLGED